MVDQLEQVERILRDLKEKQARERAVSNDPVAILAAALERQNETLLEMSRMAFEFVERTSNRSLAFYSQDAAQLDGKIRRGSPSLSAATKSPLPKQPPEAGVEGAPRGPNRRVIDRTEVIGHLDGLMHDWEGMEAPVGIESAFRPPVDIPDEPDLVDDPGPVKMN